MVLVFLYLIVTSFAVVWFSIAMWSNKKVRMEREARAGALVSRHLNPHAQ